MPDGPPPIVANGPKLTVPRSSILNVADLITYQDDRLGGGVGFRPDGSPEGAVYDVCGSLSIPAGTVTTAKEFDAFGIVAEDHSSSFGFQVGEYQERAIRKLTSVTPCLIEREFYLNTLGLTNNVALASAAATTVTTGAVPVLAGLALAEDTIATETLGGYRGIIHVRPSILTLLTNLQVVRREGNIWLTPTDNIVLPGRGYTGESPDNDAPAADSEWIYLTAGIQIHRGPVRPTPDSIGEAMNRSQNTITFYAQQEVAVVWDPDVLHHAIELDPTQLV